MIGPLRPLLLVRHPPVPAVWRGRCYGATDVLLDEAGQAAALEVAERVARQVATIGRSPGTPLRLFHSGLDRASRVAEHLARIWNVPAEPDLRLRERHFGAWEGRAWDAIHAETGSAMEGMLTDPAGWRPPGPGGETTFELRDRVLAWHAELPAAGLVVAVAHGGPIGALLGTLRGLAVADWLPLIPAPGDFSLMEVENGC